MKMTVNNIDKCLKSDPYSNGRKYFFLDKDQLSLIEQAEKAGYIARRSHTQAEWTREGIAKAVSEIKV